MAAVNVFKAVLAAFSVTLNPSKVLPKPSGDIKRYIKTTGPPIASLFWQLDSEKLVATRAEFL
jgi:hypothetical protein